MPRTAPTKRKRPRTFGSRRSRAKPRRLRYGRRTKRTRRRKRPVRRRTRNRGPAAFPLVPLPARKAITLVWRQTLHVPVSSDTTSSAVVVLKMNDPSQPIAYLPLTNALGYEINPENALVAHAQPMYHDMMRKMYKGCHVRSSTTSVRATPAQFLRPPRVNGVDQPPAARTQTHLQSTHAQVVPEAVAQPFRLCITTDEDALEDLLGSHRAYKARDQDAKFSSIKTLRTTYRSTLSTGHEGAFTKPLTCSYNFRKFWDLPASVLAYQTKYHRTVGSRRRLIADEATSGAIDPNSTLLSDASRMDYFNKNRDLIRFTKPWNSYQGENVIPNDAGYSPGSPAFLRIQALPTDHIRSTSFVNNPMVKIEVTMKFDCIFFDPTELNRPTASSATNSDNLQVEEDIDLDMPFAAAEVSAVGDEDEA